MNIFLFHLSPNQNAKEHCDRHCVKMILEYAQLLSTAHRVIDGDELDPTRMEHLYKATHVNHPCAVFTRSSYSAYTFVFLLFEALLDEYEYRYKRVHATSRLLELLRVPPREISFQWMHYTPFPQCMPDQYRVPGDACQAYQNYFNGDKQRMAKWTGRPTPSWYVKNDNTLDP